MSGSPNITSVTLCTDASPSIPLGEAEYEDSTVLAENLATNSHRVYLCPVCGAIWAKWLFSGATHWTAYRMSCTVHRWHELEHPGSLIYDRNDIRLLPREALFRETLRAMREADPTFPLFPRGR